MGTEIDSVPHVAQSAARKRSRPGADASGGGSDDDEGGEVDGDIVALAAFQLSALLHAFKFPAVRRVSYSTCSVHAAVSGMAGAALHSLTRLPAQENEEVVAKALAAEPTFRLIRALPAWTRCVWP